MFHFAKKQKRASKLTALWFNLKFMKNEKKIRMIRLNLILI